MATLELTGGRNPGAGPTRGQMGGREMMTIVIVSYLVLFLAVVADGIVRS